MNILTNKLPVTVKIGGADYAINANFRTSILFEKIMENDELEETEKAMELLQIYYPVLPSPEHVEEALNQIIWFYKCGEEEEKSKGKNITTDKIFSFKHDAKSIYNSFYKEYGIDLQEIKFLHWWKFRSLFDGLGHETEIKKIMLYRSIDLKDIKDDTQKEFYNEMKELYKLPTKKA